MLWVVARRVLVPEETVREEIIGWKEKYLYLFCAPKLFNFPVTSGPNSFIFRIEIFLEAF